MVKSHETNKITVYNSWQRKVEKLWIYAQKIVYVFYIKIKGHITQQSTLKIDKNPQHLLSRDNPKKEKIEQATTAPKM